MTPPSTNGAPFIPSWLDDAGLRPAEFRLLCRIYRRGRECFESVPSIAAGCRLKRRTVKLLIRDLVKRQILKRVHRPGFSSLLSVAPHESWKISPAPLGTQGPKQPRSPNCPPRGPFGDPTPGPFGDPGRYSKEGTPRKVLQSHVETIYGAYPKKIGKPAALRAITAALRRGIKGEELLAITQRFAKAWDGETDLQFCPHPATWFNQDRYADAPDTWRRAPKLGAKVKPESNQLEETIPAKML